MPRKKRPTDEKRAPGKKRPAGEKRALGTERPAGKKRARAEKRAPGEKRPANEKRPTDQKPLTEEERQLRQQIQQIKDLFGKSLRGLRKRMGLTNREWLATDAGVDDETLGRTERGEGNPELTTLIRIALALDLSLAQLFSSMGQNEGVGRQLTVQEREVAVSTLWLLLEAVTGSTRGELTERGITRAPSEPATPGHYPKPRARRDRR
ncbi:MAG: helix-turn-helix domain-containing protein [Luteitalea sp.]|nr:helix-turn-helix domain-containing protein [Luteitalea sp.]